MMYWQFLAYFIFPGLAVGSLLVLRTYTPYRKLWLLGTSILTFLAITYTTPWDNYLVKTEVWTYPPERVLGRIGYVPIEEYLFFALQTLLSSLWTFFVIHRKGISQQASRHTRTKLLGLLALGSLWLVSLSWLRIPRFEYLSLILSWALPVIFLQWAVGAQYFFANAKIFALSVLPVTFYLWICDAIALRLGIWKISPEQTTGIEFLGLPLEEAVFFLITNIMVVLGLILFLAMERRFPILYQKFQRWGV